MKPYASGVRPDLSVVTRSVDTWVGRDRRAGGRRRRERLSKGPETDLRRSEIGRLGGATRTYS